MSRNDSEATIAVDSKPHNRSNIPRPGWHYEVIAGEERCDAAALAVDNVLETPRRSHASRAVTKTAQPRNVSMPVSHASKRTARGRSGKTQRNSDLTPDFILSDDIRRTRSTSQVTPPCTEKTSAPKTRNARLQKDFQTEKREIALASATQGKIRFSPTPPTLGKDASSQLIGNASCSDTSLRNQAQVSSIKWPGLRDFVQATILKDGNDSGSTAIEMPEQDQPGQMMHPLKTNPATEISAVESQEGWIERMPFEQSSSLASTGGSHSHHANGVRLHANDPTFLEENERNEHLMTTRLSDGENRWSNSEISRDMTSGMTRSEVDVTELVNEYISTNLQCPKKPAVASSTRPDDVCLMSLPDLFLTSQPSRNNVKISWNEKLTTIATALDNAGSGAVTTYQQVSDGSNEASPNRTVSLENVDPESNVENIATSPMNVSNITAFEVGRFPVAAQSSAAISDGQARKNFETMKISLPPEEPPLTNIVEHRQLAYPHSESFDVPTPSRQTCNKSHYIPLSSNTEASHSRSARTRNDIYDIEPRQQQIYLQSNSRTIEYSGCNHPPNQAAQAEHEQPSPNHPANPPTPPKTHFSPHMTAEQLSSKSSNMSSFSSQGSPDVTKSFEDRDMYSRSQQDITRSVMDISFVTNAFSNKKSPQIPVDDVGSDSELSDVDMSLFEMERRVGQEFSQEKPIPMKLPTTASSRIKTVSS
jgi:hypothetical protein